MVKMRRRMEGWAGQRAVQEALLRKLREQGRGAGLKKGQGKGVLR